MKQDKFSSFRVKIKKGVLIEGEPGRTCRNYPNSEFKSYKECDDEFMKRRVGEIAPGLMPVWMTEDLSKVTTKPVVAALNDTSWYNKATSNNDFLYQVNWLPYPLVLIFLTVHFHAKSIQQRLN